jgi:hypothetical protein
MDWRCPQCGADNDDTGIKCPCGYLREEPRHSSDIRRGAKVAGALLILCVGLAPMGFAGCFQRAPWLRTATIPFWILILASTSYALMAKNEKHASIIIRGMWIVALLNFAGCVDVLGQIGQATNG